MKLTVLGSGIPLSGGDRACAGYLVESHGQFIVLDLGTGSFLNLKKIVQPSKVNALFFSHYCHADHVADLTGFLQHRRMFCTQNPAEAKQLDIFGPKGAKEFVDKNLELFPSFLQSKFPISVEEMEYDAKKVFGFSVKAKPVKHAENSIGFRVEAEGKAIAYSGDTEYCDAIIDLGKDADLLVLQCSFPAGIKHEGHLNAKECGEIAKRANAKKLLLTHFFPEAEEAELKKQAAKAFNGEIILAKDLMGIDV